MIKKLLELVRFSHTIFAMPFALASMFLAAEGWPSFKIFFLILLALVFCRNTAMAFNRLVDRDIDKKNPRTVNRHLPAGLLSVRSVLFFTIANAILFIAVTYFINSLAFYLSLPTLLLVCFYSLVKRFSTFCHFFLGLAIGISPIGAWVAVQGSFHLLPIVLGLCLMLWITGFDIIYATQDVQVDKKLGLHSMVTLLGVQGALSLSRFLHILLVVALIYIENNWQLGLPYRASVTLVSALLVYIHFFKKSSSLDSMNKDFFLANGAISLVLFIGIVTSVFTHSFHGL